MELGSHVYYLDTSSDVVWVPGVLQDLHVDSTTENVTSVSLQLDEENVTHVPLEKNEKGEWTNVLRQNLSDQSTSDLVALPHLHEASILHALRQRYTRDDIYTRIGDILISINPFKELPHIYSHGTMQMYTTNEHKSSDPHLFALAHTAYADMCDRHRSQSILISGESGAGKTEATKIMMNFFAATCVENVATEVETYDEEESQASIETQVLQSNPILEAFGNARTVRNDNSSRFGKFIELQFSERDGESVLCGAKIRTYLLEKIRVVQPSPQERNFHIFYELLAAAHQGYAGSVVPSTHNAPPMSSAAATLQDAMQQWALDLPCEDFRLLNETEGCYTRRDGVNDAEQFVRTRRGMKRLGMSDIEISSVLELVAAILHMGNIGFESASGGSTAENKENIRKQRQNSTQYEADARVSTSLSSSVTDNGTIDHFQLTATLLHVSPDDLESALTKRQVKTVQETVDVALDVSHAQQTRNALAMEYYRLLFEWVVGRVNEKISASKHADEPFIGLLDIFGFEDMAVNSFEQLCINYANEALQNQFNRFVFAEEQKLYAAEEIGWTFVDFPDNVACLHLFEQKPVGIFSLTDQECLFPQGSDTALLTKFYSEFSAKKKHSHFIEAKQTERRSQFAIAHYAGNVTYTIDGFLAKNKDFFSESAAQLLSKSSNLLIQSMTKNNLDTDSDNEGLELRRGRSSSTITMDADSRRLARPRSQSTMEPGEVKVPVTPRKTMRRGGSSISAQSVGTQFKTQLTELLATIDATTPRYVRCIKPNDTNVSNTFQCQRVLEQLRCGGVLEAVRVARAGFPIRLTHPQFLERYARILLPDEARSEDPTELVEKCVVTLLPLVHDGQGVNVHVMETAANLGVSLGKTLVFFKRTPYERLENVRAARVGKSAVVLQKEVRMFIAYRRFQKIKQSTVKVQTIVRMVKCMRFVQRIRERLHATKIQTYVRKYLAQSRYRTFRCSVVVLQSHYRRRRAAAFVDQKRMNVATLVLQTNWKKYVARRNYVGMYSAVVTLQRQQRMAVAKKELVKLKQESKDVAKLQEDNQQLKSEMAELRKQLQQMEEVLQREGICEPERESSSEVETTDRGRSTSFMPSVKSCRRRSLPPAHTFAEDLETLERNHSIGMWEAQRHYLDARVQVLKGHLRKAAEADEPPPSQEQARVLRSLVESQIRAQTLKLQLRPDPIKINSKDLPRPDGKLSDVHEDAPVGPPPVSARRRAQTHDSYDTTIFEKEQSTSRATKLVSALLSIGRGGKQEDGIGPDLTLGDAAVASGRHRGMSDASHRSTVSSGSSSASRWAKDSECRECSTRFGWFVRRHHCRVCQHSFCSEHVVNRMLLPHLGYSDLQRVCDDCFEQQALLLEQEDGCFGSVGSGSGSVSSGDGKKIVMHGFGPIAPIHQELNSLEEG